MSRRVVITGLGVVSPVGNDLRTFWQSLCEGKSGIDRVRAFDTSNFATQIGGEVKDLDTSRYVDPKEAKRLDRFILFALAASDLAIKDSRLVLTNEDATRCGVIIGSGIGGLKTLEDEQTKLVSRGPGRVSPFLIPMMISDMAPGRVSIQHGLTGPNYAVVSACASGSHAIGDAFLKIKAGFMDVAVTGGTEATITPLAFAGFCNMKAMSTRNDNPGAASSPFDKKRDGFVMGEGSGIVILESLDHALARKAHIYAELIGFGATGDAHHIVAPHPEGEGARGAMTSALAFAKLRPADIDYINTHGTSTPDGDRAETNAIKQVFGEHAYKLNINSTKSITGHLLGASGGVELIATVLSIVNSTIHPTINYETPDPECDLNCTPNKAVTRNIKYAISNSFGFGGHNASLVVSKYEGSESGQ